MKTILSNLSARSRAFLQRLGRRPTVNDEIVARLCELHGCIPPMVVFWCGWSADKAAKQSADEDRLDWLEYQVERGYYNATTGRTELSEFSVAAIKRDGIRAAIDAAMSPPNDKVQKAARSGNNHEQS